MPVMSGISKNYSENNEKKILYNFVKKYYTKFNKYDNIIFRK